GFGGKCVGLEFYPKDETPGCTKEACGFRDLYAALQESVEIIGVSADSEESHRKFRDKYQLPFLLLADPQKQAIGLYGATKEEQGKRISFLIDPQGVIRKIYLGVEP